jgi:hypothetical protein
VQTRPLRLSRRRVSERRREDGRVVILTKEAVWRKKVPVCFIASQRLRLLLAFGALICASAQDPMFGSEVSTRW